MVSHADLMNFSSSSKGNVPPANGKVTCDRKKVIPCGEKVAPDRKKKVVPNIKKETPDMKKVAPHMKKVAPDMREFAPDMNKVAPDNKKWPHHKNKVYPEGKKVDPDRKKLFPDTKKMTPARMKVTSDHDLTPKGPSKGERVNIGTTSNDTNMGKGSSVKLTGLLKSEPNAYATFKKLKRAHVALELNIQGTELDDELFNMWDEMSENQKNLYFSSFSVKIDPNVKSLKVKKSGFVTPKNKPPSSHQASVSTVESGPSGDLNKTDILYL